MARTKITRHDIQLACDTLGLNARHIPLCSGSFPHVYVKPNMDWLLTLSTGGGYLVESEVPTGAKNGANLVYNLTRVFQAGTVRFHLNGLRLTEGLDFDEGPGAQELTTAYAPWPCDRLLADYRYTP